VPAPPLPIAVLHLDESCLGNGREGATPGGAGGLIEARAGAVIQRRDLFLHAPDTTNNRMALAGAIAALQLLAAKNRRLRVLLVSDSEYLIKGMREWVPGWIARGWTRKGGTIENLELWRVLVDSAKKHEVQWTWVRGHQGHAKNEYANDLAVKAATEQITSQGAEESGFPAWLAGKQTKHQYDGYDPDATFVALEQRLAVGERFALRDEEGEWR
jgi:ribonuclease HI